MVHLSTSRIFQLAPSRWGSIDPRRKNRIKTTAKRTPEEAWKLADFAHLTSIPDWWKLTPVAKKKHVTKTHKHTHTHLPLYKFRANFFCENSFQRSFFGFNFFQGPESCFKNQVPKSTSIYQMILFGCKEHPASPPSTVSQAIQSLENKSPSSFASPDANYFFRANATTKPAFLNKKE